MVDIEFFNFISEAKTLCDVWIKTTFYICVLSVMIEKIYCDKGLHGTLHWVWNVQEILRDFFWIKLDIENGQIKNIFEWLKICLSSPRSKIISIIIEWDTWCLPNSFHI